MEVGELHLHRHGPAEGSRLLAPGPHIGSHGLDAGFDFLRRGQVAFECTFRSQRIFAGDRRRPADHPRRSRSRDTRRPICRNAAAEKPSDFALKSAPVRVAKSRHLCRGGGPDARGDWQPAATSRRKQPPRACSPLRASAEQRNASDFGGMSRIFQADPHATARERAAARLFADSSCDASHTVGGDPWLCRTENALTATATHHDVGNQPTANLQPRRMTMSLRINAEAPNFTAETTQGTIDFHALDRRWLGHPVLASQGLHPGLHHRTGLHGRAEAGVRQAQHQDHRPQRRSGGKSFQMGRRTSRKPRVTPSTTR